MHATKLDLLNFEFKLYIEGVDLVIVNENGLYCRPGDFYIDPWRPVEKALITHAHADHARVGHKHYWCTPSSLGILQHRLGDLNYSPVPYGQIFELGDVKVSFHPAGHVLGSCQVRIEHKGNVWVVTGDFKRGFDPSCEAFEVVECDTMIMESTFGIPVYQWKSGAQIAREIWDWKNQHAGPSVLFCYSLGKAQRVLAELASITTEKVYLHGAMERITEVYRQNGITLVPTANFADLPPKYEGQTLILAPPSAQRSPWMKRFRNFQTGFASGWMQVRGNRRRRNVEKGFILSDHADWNELVQTAVDSKASRILVTHGQTEVFSKYLKEELKIDAAPLQTLFEGEVAGE